MGKDEPKQEGFEKFIPGCSKAKNRRVLVYPVMADSVDVARTFCTISGGPFTDDPLIYVIGLFLERKLLQRLYGKWVVVKMGREKLAGRVEEPDSQYARKGKNLAFLVCSKECGEILQSIIGAKRGE